jgi:hypothetical protein
VVKLPFTSTTLLLEGSHLPILISATRLEVEEGLAIGLEYPELPGRALIDTGASLTIINPEIATTCKLKQTGFEKLNAVSFPGSEIPGLEPFCKDNGRTGEIQV